MSHQKKKKCAAWLDMGKTRGNVKKKKKLGGFCIPYSSQMSSKNSLKFKETRLEIIDNLLGACFI